MRIAGVFILISLALHVVALVQSGFAEDIRFMVAHLVIYPLLFAGLARGKMWVAWVALIFMIVGASVSMAQMMSGSILPDWIEIGIITADIAAAILLVGAIWRGGNAKASGAWA